MEEELSKKLKTIASNILKTGCENERRIVLEDHFTDFIGCDLPLPALKAALKLLSTSISRQWSKQNRRLALHLAKEVITKNKSCVGQMLVCPINVLLPTSAIAKPSLYALDWALLLCRYGNANEMVPVLSSLLYNVTASGDRRLSILAQKKMMRTFVEKDSVKRYVDAVNEDAGWAVLALVAMLADVMFRRGWKGLLDSSLGPFFTLFLKLAYVSKSPCPPMCLFQTTKPLMARVTHKQFVELFLPTWSRGFVRMPEFYLDAVIACLPDLSLDLSPYALKLSELFTGRLQQDPLKTVRLFTALAPQCSDAAAIEDVVKYLVALLVGGATKLTNVEHKVAVMSAISSFHVSPLGGSVQSLVPKVIDLCLQYLETEKHEISLARCLKQFSGWTSLAKNTVTRLTDFIVKKLEDKSTTNVLRAELLQLVLATYKADSLFASTEIPLKFLIERGYASPLVVSAVVECLYATTMVARQHSKQLIGEDKQFWIRLFDPKKQILTTQKVLLVSADEVLLSFIELFGLLASDHNEELNSPQGDPFLYAILIVLHHPSWTVRQAGLQKLAKVANYLSLKSIRSLLRHWLTLADSQLPSNPDADKAVGFSLQMIPAKLLSVSLTTIAVGMAGDSESASSIGVEFLAPSHHEALASYKGDVWFSILRLLKLDPCHALESLSGLPASASVLQTVVAMTGNYSGMWDLLEAGFETGKLLSLTREDVKIYGTAEGQLWDLGVVDSANRDAVMDKNIRRKDKNYSYEDHMMDVELAKIALAKSGGLTESQKKAKDAQLKKESEIRSKVKEIATVFTHTMELLNATLRTSPADFQSILHKVMRKLCPLVHSPLAAPAVIQFFVDFWMTISDELPHPTLPYTMARCLNPKVEVPANWSHDPLPVATQKAMTSLDKLKDPLSSAALTFVIPMLEVISGQPDLAVSLRILGRHCRVPTHSFLRTRMVTYLTGLIASSPAVVQNEASQYLTQLCESSFQDGECTILDVDVAELLDGLLSRVKALRRTCLECLLLLVDLLPSVDYKTDPISLTCRLWVIRFDPEEDIGLLAEQLWSLSSFRSDSTFAPLILDDLARGTPILVESASSALAEIVRLYPVCMDDAVRQLIDLYQRFSVRTSPLLDSVGRVVEAARQDPHYQRLGVAASFEKMAPFLNESNTHDLFEFYMSLGLQDQNDVVRKRMMQSAVTVVHYQGKDMVDGLLVTFQTALSNLPAISDCDVIRQGIVVLMGSLAQHLAVSDERIRPIVVKLFETLKTPSQQVQEAVAKCLPPLVPSVKDESQVFIDQLLLLLLEGDNYGDRKGAAYGIAGFVKGLGILSLKQLNIINTLTAALQDKKNVRKREGGLLAFEMLCLTLGRLFEPYIVNVIPHLLVCFGDANPHVRKSADDASKALMSQLSAPGVKLILPSLLRALEDDSWRTKVCSVDLLGAVAFCAPKQLSSCLPTIVPRLMEVLVNSHSKVQEAGKLALKQIGSVITNPEIQSMVPTLLDALGNPGEKTAPCLKLLLDTQFVHYIDAASLALILPVVENGFRIRSTEIRKMSSQIIGNMYSLTDHKELNPYLSTIKPGLRQCLTDPVPDVRTASAKALGAMVASMPEDSFKDTQDWLFVTLVSEQSGIDRAGAAQGLSEVLAAFGEDRLGGLMPQFIKKTCDLESSPTVRDGYLLLFLYLPMAFGDKFSGYVGAIIPSILKSLADETEFVRETALRAGQRIVGQYADTAMQLLLPELEKGLFDENWRIRLSSMELLGDLLFHIIGVSGSQSTEVANEDDTFGSEKTGKALVEALGRERQHRVLAGLYMGRCDTSLLVRQAATHVWKVVVYNTARTLKDILSTMFELLLGCLASSCADKQHIAARTLGDLARKLGDRILPEIIPIMETGLLSEREDLRQGVCIGLMEILASTSKEQVYNYADSVVGTVKKSLLDKSPNVRIAASKTFNQLYTAIGHKACEEILPDLLDKMATGGSDAEIALDGLTNVMAVRSKVILPVLIPKLTQPPVNTRALALLTAVAGEALNKHLPKVLRAFVVELSLGELQKSEDCRTLILSVKSEDGTKIMVQELLSLLRETELCAATLSVLVMVCQDASIDVADLYPDITRGLIKILLDEDSERLHLTMDALSALNKRLSQAAMIANVYSLKQSIQYLGVNPLKPHAVPGLCLPKKGIMPLFPILREGLLTGSPDLKESSANTLGQLIKMSTVEALQPSVVQLTGPLIRVLGDRYGWTVKAAVLETIAILLGKVGVVLKPFLPQLQTTLTKALNDANRSVRMQAAQGISVMATIHPRIDPMVTELTNMLKNNDDNSLRETTLHALRGILKAASTRISDPLKSQVITTCSSLLSIDPLCYLASGCIGCIAAYLPEEELNKQLRLLTSATDDSKKCQVNAIVLSVMIKEGSEHVLSAAWTDKIQEALNRLAASDRIPVAQSSIVGLTFLSKSLMQRSDKPSKETIATYETMMVHYSTDVRITVLRCIASLPPLGATEWATLAKHLLSNTKEKNTAVKAWAESALVSASGASVDEGIEHIPDTSDPLVNAAVKDTAKKVLKKYGSSPPVEIDETLLTS